MIEATSSRRRPIVIATIAIAVAVAIAIGLAASYGLDAEPDSIPPSHVEYLPSISDLMIATIQPRHGRLWRAEQDGDWEFAAYELGNLDGAFKRLGLAHPTEHDISFPDMIASVSGEVLANHLAGDTAIARHDRRIALHDLGIRHQDCAAQIGVVLLGPARELRGHCDGPSASSTPGAQLPNPLLLTSTPLGA